MQKKKKKKEEGNAKRKITNEKLKSFDVDTLKFFHCKFHRLINRILSAHYIKINYLPL